MSRQKDSMGTIANGLDQPTGILGNGLAQKAVMMGERSPREIGMLLPHLAASLNIGK